MEQLNENSYKGKTAREMAELTSRKDAVILSKDTQLKEVSEKLDAAVKKAKSTKVGKPRTLKNGNVETISIVGYN